MTIQLTIYIVQMTIQVSEYSNDNKQLTIYIAK